VKRLCLFLTVGGLLILCTSVAVAQDYTGGGGSSASATPTATASSTSTASSTATAGRLPETGPHYRLKKTGGFPLTGPLVLAAVATAAAGVAAIRAVLRRYTSS
jgi:hypothetical protein